MDSSGLVASGAGSGGGDSTALESQVQQLTERVEQLHDSQQRLLALCEQILARLPATSV